MTPLARETSTPSLWLDPLSPAAYPRLDGEVDVDVAVIGGGITGVACAWFLAHGGARVALLEERTLGAGATGRNAGFLLHGPAEYYAQAVWLYGRPLAREIWEFSRENHRLIDALAASERIDCGLRRGGSYSVACSEEEWRVVRESAALLREDGFAADEAAPAQLPAAMRGGTFRGAAVNGRDGEFRPVAFLRGLATAAAGAGARIFEETRLPAVTGAGDRLSFAGGSGRVTAEAAVYATNAYTPLVQDFFSEIIAPVRAQMLALEPVGERLFDRPAYANYGHEYWRQLPDGAILFGGGREFAPEAEKGYEERPTDRIQGHLDAFLARHFPALRGARVTHRWAGLMGFTCDGLPVVGPLPGRPRVYVAAGYNGHGLGFAVAAAKAVADMLLGGRSAAPAAFSPRRFL